MLTFDATEQINEVSRTRTRTRTRTTTRTTTTQVITRYFGRWPQTKTALPFGEWRQNLKTSFPIMDLRERTKWRFFCHWWKPNCEPSIFIKPRIWQSEQTVIHICSSAESTRKHLNCYWTYVSTSTALCRKCIENKICHSHPIETDKRSLRPL